VFGPSSNVNYFTIAGLDRSEDIGYCPTKDGIAYLVTDDTKPWGKKFSPELCLGYHPSGRIQTGAKWWFLQIEHVAPGAWITKYFYLEATSNLRPWLFRYFSGSGEFYIHLYLTTEETAVDGTKYHQTTSYSYGGGFSGDFTGTEWNQRSAYRATMRSMMSNWSSGVEAEYRQMVKARKDPVDRFIGVPNAYVFLQRPSDAALQRVRDITASLAGYIADQVEWQFRDKVYTEYPDLVKEAVKDVQYVDINTAMYLRDLPALFGELKEAVKLIRTLKPLPKSIGKLSKSAIKSLSSKKSILSIGRKGITKSLKPLGKQMFTAAAAGSSLYLSAKYGTRLTVADTKELYKAYRRFVSPDGVLDVKSLAGTLQRIREAYEKAFCSFSSVVRAKSKVGKMKIDVSKFVDPLEVSDVEYQTTVSIRYHNRRQDAQPVLNVLRQMDLYPTATNIWDAIPYSFVVDWFIPVEELLEQVDVWEQLSWLDIISYTKSIKATCTASINLADSGLSGLVLGDKLDYTITFYQRVVQSHLDTPVWDSSLRFTDKSAKHVPELTALMVQKWGRLLASRLR
jgi:hypothetical protein